MSDLPSTFFQNMASAAKANSFFKHGLWWLHGSGEILLEHGLKRMRDQWQAAAQGPSVSLEAAQLKEEEWYNFFQEVSLFGDKQLILIRGIDKKAEFPKWLTQVPRVGELANTIVLISVQKELKAAVSKEWQRIGGKVQALNDPQSWELAKTLPWLAADFGFKLDGKAIPLLLESQGQDLLKVKNVLSLCEQLLPKGTLLDAEKLSPLLGGLREDHAFRFYEFVLSGNLAQAEALILNLLERGEKGIALLGVIASLLRKLVNVADLSSRGFSERDISQQLAMSPFQAKQYLTFAKSQKKEKLLNALTSCHDADLTLKSTRLPENLILSGILANLS